MCSITSKVSSKFRRALFQPFPSVNQTNSRPTTNTSEGSRPSTTIEPIKEVKFENFAWPVDGQKYTSEVKLPDDFPGKITRYTFQMFNKSLDDTEASAGDNVDIIIYVQLNDGYTWAETKTAYLLDTAQEEIVYNESMGREFGFKWNHRTEYTDAIKIEEQSPEVVEFAEGEDISLNDFPDLSENIFLISKK